MIKGIPDRKFYIVFRSADYKGMPRSWRCLYQAFYLFKESGWEHIDIFYEDQAGQSVFFGVAPWQIGIFESGLTLKEMLIKLRGSTTACIEVTSLTRSDNYLPRGMISCTTVVKAMLGLRGVFLNKPKQIFNVLKKKGGIVLWEPRHYQ